MQVSDNGPDGATFGASATEKVSLFGATPVVQQTAPSALTPATDTTSTISTAVNTIRTALVNVGIIA
jgi:hypothetical protein